ncbi:hypothetical protein [Paracoccus ravus]|uniref:hypothetical protein n=1 Tax=Paracoccus ravus TaxID=2447760 RepID=UPI00106E27BC|nr:hypothetical protein [Paracoccus ravus]
MNRLGDTLSGAGAVILSVSHMCVGNMLLTIASSLTMAGGKLGNAFIFGQASERFPRLAHALRCVPPVSRIPGLLALTIQLKIGLQEIAIRGLEPAIQPRCS